MRRPLLLLPPQAVHLDVDAGRVPIRQPLLPMQLPHTPTPSRKPSTIRLPAAAQSSLRVPQRHWTPKQPHRQRAQSN